MGTRPLSIVRLRIYKTLLKQIMIYAFLYIHCQATMATTGETAPVPNTNNGGPSEGAEQKEQFVGNRFYARSIGSDIGPSSNSSVQIIRHDSFRIDFFIDAYHFLEIQLIPFSKRLFV